MHRLYLKIENIPSEEIILKDKEQLHYLKDVLRLKLKEEVYFFDDAGNEYLTELKGLSPVGLTFKIKERRQFIPVSKIRLTIACAIPKKSKIEDIIDKLTQLGVDKIIPLDTERVVVRLGQDKKKARLERWKKIALAAVQQSQRNVLPVIEPVTKFKDLLRQTQDYDLKLIPNLESPARKNLKEIFAQGCPKNILVLIGPEGDFSPQEVRAALNAGFIPVTLGDTVLRVETAAVAVASFIKFNEND